MKTFINFIVSRFKMGVLFLASLLVVAIIFEKAFHILQAVMKPVMEKFPNYHILGVGLRSVLIILIILLLCVLLGLFAVTRIGKNFSRSIENSILNKLPGYTFIKTMSESMMGMEKEDAKTAVMVRFDDSMQIGFLIEELDNEMVSVFIPGSPSPWSGAVFLVQRSRISPMNIPAKDAMFILSQMGKGAKKIFPSSTHS